MELAYNLKLQLHSALLSFITTHVAPDSTLYVWSIFPPNSDHVNWLYPAKLFIHKR